MNKILFVLSVIQLKPLLECPILLDNNSKYYFHLNTKIYFKYDDLEFALYLCKPKEKNILIKNNFSKNLFKNNKNNYRTKTKINYKFVKDSTIDENNNLNWDFNFYNYKIIINGICNYGKIEENNYNLSNNVISVKYKSMKFCSNINYGYTYWNNYKFISIFVLMILATILSLTGYSLRYNLKFINLFYSWVNWIFLVVIMRHYWININSFFSENIFLLIFFSIFILLYLSFKYKIFRSINAGFMFFITYEFFIFNYYQNNISILIFFIICISLSIILGIIDIKFSIIYFSSSVSAFIFYFVFYMIIDKEFILKNIYDNQTISNNSYYFVIIFFLVIYNLQFYNYYKYIWMKKIKKENINKIRSIHILDC